MCTKFVRIVFSVLLLLLLIGTIIDVKKRKVIAPTIVVGQSPDSVTIAPNGKHAYVTNYTSNVVSVIKLDE